VEAGTRRAGPCLAVSETRDRRCGPGATAAAAAAAGARDVRPRATICHDPGRVRDRCGYREDVEGMASAGEAAGSGDDEAGGVKKWSAATGRRGSGGTAAVAGAARVEADHRGRAESLIELRRRPGGWPGSMAQRRTAPGTTCTRKIQKMHRTNVGTTGHARNP
jgi:hypothetical protein